MKIHNNTAVLSLRDEIVSFREYVLEKVDSDTHVVYNHDAALHESHPDYILMRLLLLEHLLKNWNHLVLEDPLYYWEE